MLMLFASGFTFFRNLINCNVIIAITLEISWKAPKFGWLENYKKEEN